MTGKSVKDVDRYQAVLANLLLEEDNKFCADCQSKGSVYPAAGRTSSILWLTESGAQSPTQQAGCCTGAYHVKHNSPSVFGACQKFPVDINKYSS